MKTLTNTLLLTGCALFAAAVAPAQDRIIGQALPPRCLATANNDAAIMKAKGVAVEVVESRYQMEVAICNGNSPLVAALVGAANLEYARLARQVATGAISPPLYLGLSRAVNRKLYLARQNPKWAAEYAKGDADGDLVPDSMDACPNTADLTPTTDNGCTSLAPLPVGPDEHQMDMLRNTWSMVTSKACDGAPEPNKSQVNKAGYDNLALTDLLNGAGSFAFSVSPVNNQPAACPVFYEIELRFFNPASPGAPANLMYNLVFRETESMDPFNIVSRRVFHAKGTAPGQFGALYKGEITFPFDSLELRVRSLNGNGQTQGWGPTTRIEGRPFFNE